eukprot:14289929-Alexandrium_andersonii.AAC.1
MPPPAYFAGCRRLARLRAAGGVAAMARTFAVWRAGALYVPAVAAFAAATGPRDLLTLAAYAGVR